MARLKGGQPATRRSWSFFLSALLLIEWLRILAPEEANAALLNGALTGSIEAAYTYLDMNQDGVKSGSRSIEQRYSLRYSEELLDSRIGLFTAGVNWVDDQTSYSGMPEDSARYTIRDYNLNLSLLPLISPLTLYAQRTERENQFDMLTRDTLSTYGFGWTYLPANLPRIGINGSHSTYSSDEAGLFPTLQTDFLTIDTGGKWQNYNVTARYLYNQTEDTVNGNTWSHGVNLNLSGAITKELSVGSYLNYATRGGNAAGMNYFQENGIGVSLYYLPSKFWDASARFDMDQAPGEGDFTRTTAGGGLNFHPVSQLDVYNNGQISRFESTDSQTDSVFGSSSLIYRPAFGWTLTGGAGAGYTLIEGGGIEAKSDQVTLNSSLTYYRSLTYVHLTGGVSGSYARNDSNLIGLDTDRLLSITGGIDNTQTQYIHVGLSGSLTSINRDVPAESDDQKETRIALTGDTHYFRNLFIYNDSLTLDGTLTYLDVTGYGTDTGRTLSEEFHGNYQFLGTFNLIGSLSHYTYPTGYYGGNSTIASLDFTGAVRPWNNGNLTFDFKELANQRDDQYTQKTFEADGKLSHQIGRLTLSTEYTYLRNEVGPTETTSQEFLVRAIRTF